MDKHIRQLEEFFLSYLFFSFFFMAQLETRTKHDSNQRDLVRF